MHQLGANAPQQGIVKGGRPFREMSGQRDLRRAERPDVQVMNPVDFGETHKVVANGCRVDARRNCIEGQVYGIREQFPGAQEDKKANE
jgi:hypothetical protein